MTHTSPVLVVFVSMLVSMASIGQAQSIDAVKQQIRDMYDQYPSLGMIAESADDGRKIIVATSSDGRYSFIQYDKQMLDNIYSTDRDTEQEWKVVPAHFNYYDGKQSMISSAPFDPARMYVERRIDEPMPLGSSIQSQHCVWPIMPALLDRGDLSVSDGHPILYIKDLDMRVHMNSGYQITRVSLGEDKSPTSPIVSFRFSGFDNPADPLFPTTMHRAFSHAQSGPDGGGLDHEHYTLRFVHAQDQVAKLITFRADPEIFVRKDAATDNVYDAQGNLLYNEKESAEEYLAAINRSGPGRWRFALLIGVGVLAAGSAVMLKLKGRAA